jgi:hypothetical protein
MHPSWNRLLKGSQDFGYCEPDLPAIFGGIGFGGRSLIFKNTRPDRMAMAFKWTSFKYKASGTAK